MYFYVENNTKNQLLQKVKKHAYENEYINDIGLKGIKDSGKEVIKNGNDIFSN